MTSLLLSPHNDDEVLFASFIILRHRPLVITCFRSYVQERRGGPTWQTREAETAAALTHLGMPAWRQLPVRDDQPDREMLVSCLTEFEILSPWEMVFAPAFEEGGHEQHNLVAEVAVEVFGSRRVGFYHTYKRGFGKTESDSQVPFEPHWIGLKLRALSEYRSQIELDNCAYWFIDPSLREWYG